MAGPGSCRRRAAVATAVRASHVVANIGELGTRIAANHCCSSLEARGLKTGLAFVLERNFITNFFFFLSSDPKAVWGPLS